MNTPTPRTDEAEFNGRDMGNDSNPPHFKCVDADFARTLERERAEANRKLEIEQMRETCSQCNQDWHPSLVESGWCIFCICKDKDLKLEAAKEALLYYENQTENSPAIHGGSYARKALTIINSTKGD